MYKLLKFFWLGGENHSQKTSKSGGFFSRKSLPHTTPRAACSIVSLETQQNYEIFTRNLQIFSECKNSWKCFHWEVKNTARKPANLVEFFQQITYFNKKSHSVKSKHKQIAKSVIKKLEILTKINFLIDSYNITRHQ